MTKGTNSKARDRWLDMTKYETLLAAQEATGERAIEALDMAHALLEWIGHPGQGFESAHMHLAAYTAFSRHAELDTYRAESPSGSQEVARAMAGPWLRNLHAMVDAPFTVWVTPRMCALARSIADEDIDLPLLPFDPPAQQGCFMLASPLYLYDYTGPESPVEPRNAVTSPLPVTVLAWGHDMIRVATSPQGEGFTLVPSEWKEGLRQSGMEVDDGYVRASHGTDIAVDGVEHGQGIVMVAMLERKRLDFAPRSAVHNREYPGAFVPFETTGWAFNRPWETNDDALTMDPNESLTMGAMPETIGTMRRYMLALFMLVAQEVAVLAPFKPDRASARRMARSNPNFGDVQIMRLRRIYDPLVELSDEERAERKRLDRVWSHRWRVREHWAWRACGPNGSERRMVLIPAHVKGPAHLPLIEKERVYSLER